MKNLYSILKQKRSYLKTSGLAALLIISLPFVTGQGGCETLNINDIGAISSRINSNIARSKGDYKAAAGWAGAAQLYTTASRREYQNKQEELARNAQIEAANIRAEAERDAARIRAQEDNSRRSAPQKLGNYQVPRKAAVTRNDNAYACNEQIIDSNNILRGYRGKGKVKFNETEPLQFFLQTYNKKDSVVVMKVFENDNKEPFGIESKVVEFDDSCVGVMINSPRRAGNYKCEFYVDGNPQPSRVVEVKVINSKLEAETLNEQKPVNSLEKSNEKELANNLKKLKKLREAEIFTEEEYQIKRKTIIENAYK